MYLLLGTKGKRIADQKLMRFKTLIVLTVRPRFLNSDEDTFCKTFEAEDRKKNKITGKKMTRGHKNTKTTAQGHSSKTFYKCIAKITCLNNNSEN